MYLTPVAQKRTKIAQAELNCLLALQEAYVAGNQGVRTHFRLTELDDLNLANRTLDGIDFSGSSFVHASLNGSSLVRSSLYCAVLCLCDLRYAILRAADMRGASLRGARLAHAVLDHADLRAAAMTYVELNVLSISGYAEQKAENTDARQDKSANGVDFSNCSLKYVSFENARLEDVDFSDTLLNGALFQGRSAEECHNARRRADGRGSEISRCASGSSLGMCDRRHSAGHCESGDAQGRTRCPQIVGREQWQSRFRGRTRRRRSASSLGVFRRPSVDRFVGQKCGRRLVSIFTAVHCKGQNSTARICATPIFPRPISAALRLSVQSWGHARFDKAQLENLCLLSGEILSPSFCNAKALPVAVPRRDHGRQLGKRSVWKRCRKAKRYRHPLRPARPCPILSWPAKRRRARHRPSLSAAIRRHK